MTEFGKEFVVSTLSNLVAAILLMLAGFTAAKVRSKSGNSGIGQIRLVELPARPGSIRRALRPKNIIIAFLLGILGFVLHMRSIGGNSVPFTPGSAPHDAQSMRNDSRFTTERARYEADGVIKQGEQEAYNVLSEADRDARPLLESQSIAEKEEGKRILSRAKQKADRVIAWHQEQANRIIRQAETEAADLRRMASEVDSRAYGPDTGDGYRVAEDFMSGFTWLLLIVAFLGMVSHGLGLTQPTVSGFLGIGLTAVVLSLNSSLGFGSGLMGVFGPMLLAAAFFAGQDKRLSIGEVVLNAFYAIYRRFGAAIGLAVAVMALVMIIAVVVSVVIGMSDTIRTLAESIMGEGTAREELNLGIGLIALGGGAAVGIFCSYWFLALSAAVFYSVLAGPLSNPLVNTSTQTLIQSLRKDESDLLL